MIVKASIFRCIGKDAHGQVVARVNVIANGPIHASRTATKWAKECDKGFVTFNPLDCKRRPGDSAPLYLDWEA